MNFGPVHIPDPADYDMSKPEQCRDFYSNLEDEYHELTNIMGGFAGRFAGPALEEYLNDLGDPVFERLQTQDCADANKNDISDGWEVPGPVADLPDLPVHYSDVDSPPELVDNTPPSDEPSGTPQEDVVWLPPQVVGGTPPPQEASPTPGPVVELPPFLIEVDQLPDGPPGADAETVDPPSFLIDDPAGETPDLPADPAPELDGD